MAVGMIAIGAWIGELVGDQAGEAREGVGGAVHAIRDHRQGSTHGPHQKLQQRHADVQTQGHHEDPAHLLAVVDHRDGMTVGHNCTGPVPKLWRSLPSGLKFWCQELC